MKKLAAQLSALVILAIPASAIADAATGFDDTSYRTGGKELPPYLQCVPYARQLSGVQIYGDAHTWWNQAAGKYARGNAPEIGAVMAFQPHGNMRLGHVAAVSRIIDNRTVLLDHANWSPINGRRGQIERNVQAVDVSPGNDWSQVRVWYAPLGALGTTVWPVHGFIYGKGGKTRGDAPRRPQIASAAPARTVATVPAPAVPPVRRQSSAEFTQAFAMLSAPALASTRAPAAQQPVRAAAVRTAPAPRRVDPLEAAVRRYEN